MGAPSLISSPASAFDVATTPKSVSITTAVGDVVVVAAATDYASSVVNTPTNTGTAQTWTLRQNSNLNGWSAVWTTVSTAAQTTTVSAAGGSGSLWGLQAWVWRGSGGVGASNKASNGSGSPSLSLTTTGANSAICAVNCDYNARTGTSTWTAINVAGTPDVTYQNAADYSAYTVHWTDCGGTGAKTVTQTAPTLQGYELCAVEVLGSSGAAFTGPSTAVAITSTRSASLIFAGIRAAFMVEGIVGVSTARTGGSALPVRAVFTTDGYVTVGGPGNAYSTTYSATY